MPLGCRPSLMVWARWLFAAILEGIAMAAFLGVVVAWRLFAGLRNRSRTVPSACVGHQAPWVCRVATMIGRISSSCVCVWVHASLCVCICQIA